MPTRSLYSPHNATLPFTLLRPKKDRGPATRLLPVLDIERDPRTLLIILDDDQIVHTRTLELLVRLGSANPGRAASLMGFLGFGGTYGSHLTAAELYAIREYTTKRGMTLNRYFAHKDWFGRRAEEGLDAREVEAMKVIASFQSVVLNSGGDAADGGEDLVTVDSVVDSEEEGRKKDLERELRERFLLPGEEVGAEEGAEAGTGTLHGESGATGRGSVSEERESVASAPPAAASSVGDDEDGAAASGADASEKQQIDRFGYFEDRVVRDIARKRVLRPHFRLRAKQVVEAIETQSAQRLADYKKSKRTGDVAAAGRELDEQDGIDDEGDTEEDVPVDHAQKGIDAMMSSGARSTSSRPSAPNSKNPPVYGPVDTLHPKHFPLHLKSLLDTYLLDSPKNVLAKGATDTTLSKHTREEIDALYKHRRFGWADLYDLVQKQHSLLGLSVAGAPPSSQPGYGRQIPKTLPPPETRLIPKKHFAQHDYPSSNVQAHLFNGGPILAAYFGAVYRRDFFEERVHEVPPECRTSLRNGFTRCRRNVGHFRGTGSRGAAGM